MKLIDAHAHLQFSQFDEDREEVIKRAREAGIGVINVGTDLATSRGAIELAEAHSSMWATVGIHPTDLPEPDQTEKVLTELSRLARLGRVVGIGECGLDYFHIKDGEARKKQKEIFERQIDLANKVKKPLMLHLRGNGVYREAYEILKSEAQILGNAHFFAGTREEAKLFLDLGFTLSFTGVITFPPKAGQPRADTDEVLKNIPLDRILIETDCPFVAPAPYRGKRNEPSYLPVVAERLAAIKGLAVAEIAVTTLSNTRRLFNLALS
ncbi:MAG: TatD family hydrolase [Candidatus Vogelbacteria bacterium]